MTPEEYAGAARSAAVAGICPTTEANLGDGIFDMPRGSGMAAAGALARTATPRSMRPKSC
jgi:cytosine/adenosine deaminase-related metal-dependent hydrolase